MKATTLLLIKEYSKMSGDQKVRLGLSLSEMVRKVRKTGEEVTKKSNAKHTRTTS